ncbi:MAG: Antibiotic efflux pump outer membrane protein ArpC [Chlamydiae bacterium]|nr:Antibiotic efflux pump outer membrane protein ArpC [Chlamydiota bacterium]
MGLFVFVLLALLTTGCYVNRAVIDPFAYAPNSPCQYWGPDSEASALADCEPVAECPEIPEEEHILSLAEVLDIALVNNPSTQISWALAREYAAEYGRTQSTAFPIITASYHHTSSRTSYLASQVEQPQNIMMETLIINNQEEWGPQGQVSWTLLDFGQRRYTSEAARYALYYADYMHNQSIQTLIQDVTLDFYSYLYQKKLLEADEADLATAEETLDAAELALKNGVKNISDVLQARTQALLAEIQLSEQYKAVNTAYSTLLATMGLPANGHIELQKLPFVDPESIDLDPLDEYLDIAMQCRPDLLAARSGVISAELAVKAAKRAWTPVVDYSLEVGNTSYSGGFNDRYNYVSALTVSMPLFTGFKIRNSIRLTEAAVEREEATLKQVELNTVKDVSTSHYNVSVAFNTLKVAIQFLKAAKEEYEVAISQYKVGVNTILDVLSAQSSLFDARAKQAQAIQEWFTSLSTLTYSVGLMSYNLGECP